MLNKRARNCSEAVADIADGAVIMVGGFGEAGSPIELLHALVDQGARELTIIANNAGNGRVGIASLMAKGRIKKIVCSFPKSDRSEVFPSLYRSREIELEVVPQGTLAERIRSAGAGIGGFYTRTGVGTLMTQGKEIRKIHGDQYVLEYPLFADFCLVKCDVADDYGNLIFAKTARNFAPAMCMAAKTSIVQARSIVPAGSIDPEHVIVPSIFVKRVVEVTAPQHERQLVDQGGEYP